MSYAAKQIKMKRTLNRPRVPRRGWNRQISFRFATAHRWAGPLYEKNVYIVFEPRQETDLRRKIIANQVWNPPPRRNPLLRRT